MASWMDALYYREVISRVVGAVLAHPRVAWVAWALVALTAMLGVHQLRVDFSSTAFYGDDAEPVAELRAFTGRWGPDDRTLAVVVRSQTDLFSSEGFSLLSDIEDRLAETDAVAATTSLGSLRQSGSQRGFAQRWLEADEPERALARIAIDASDAIPLLLSRDHRSAVVTVTLRESTDDLAAAIEAVAQVRKALPPTSEGCTLELAGIPAIRAAFFELTLLDQSRLGPLALLIAVAGLWLATRRIQVALVAAIGAGIPPLLLAGLMGMTGTPVGLLTQALFTLLPIIAVADTVHVVFRVRAVAAELDRPATSRVVLEEAFCDVGLACLLTTVTTAVGFASMLVAELPLLRAFGLWAALGVMGSYAVVLTLLPAVLSGFDVGAGAPQGSARLRRLAQACTRRPTWVLAVALGLTLGSIPAMQSVVVDNHLGALLRPEHPVRRAASQLDTELGGTLTLEVELESERPWVSDAPALRKARRALAALPNVRVVRPAQYSGRWARLTVHVPDVGGRAFARLEADADATLAKLGLTARTTGTASLAYRGVNRITDALRVSLIGVMGVVLLLVGGLLRSAGLALRSLLPNLLPLLLGYALVGLAALELDPIGAVILTVALGIAVDDTLHILSGFVRARARGADPQTAATDAVATRGLAILVTSGVLVAGLAVNTLSAFPPLAVLGSLGSTVIALALVADVTLLPALLVWPRWPNEGPAPHTGSESRAAGPR
ncbi:MAG: MMPL family transporter [Nannocystaceae bacterium]|nr:MMPL family transporter [Nannocystaceae bacterium]